MLSYKVSECERGRRKSTGFSWFVHINFDFDHDTKINMTRIHLKAPSEKFRGVRAQPSAIFMCLVLPFLNATTNTGTITIHSIHSIHPSKPQTPHKNSVFTQFIFFAFHFRSADFSGLCFFQVFFFILLLGLARTQSVYSLSGESFIRIAHNDLTFAQDKVSSFRWPIQHDYCANGIAHRKIPRLFWEILLLLLGFCHSLPTATK